MDDTEREAESERETETAPPLVEEVQEEKVQLGKERVELEWSVAFTTHAEMPDTRRTFTAVNMKVPVPLEERREEVMLNGIEANEGMNVMEVRVTPCHNRASLHHLHIQCYSSSLWCSW